MKLRTLFLSVLPFLFLSATAAEDDGVIDSLKTELRNAASDTAEIKLQIELGEAYARQENIDLAFHHYNYAVLLAKIENRLDLEGQGLYRIGSLCDHIHRTDSAIYFWEKSFEAFQKIPDSSGMSSTLYSIGRLHFYTGEMKIEYFLDAERYLPVNADPKRRAMYKMVIGVVLQNEDINESIRYQEEALQIKRDNNFITDIPVSLNNLAEQYWESEQHDKAWAAVNESIDLSLKNDDKYSLAYARYIVGKFKRLEGKYQEATKYFLGACNFWEEVNHTDDLINVYNELSMAYREIGQYKLGLEYKEKYIELKETRYNEEKLAKINELEVKHQKAEDQLKIKDQQLALEQEKSEKEAINSSKNLQMYLFIGIILVMLLNGIYLLIIYLRKKKDQELIASQKDILEEQHKEITDSIQYATRLQKAIFPSDKKMKLYLPDSFVMFQPKDLVSGDFYWLQPIDDKVFVAAADCTGHGVPGAMVSVVCNNALNRAVNEFGLRDVGRILDQVTDLVIEHFAQNDEEVRDGMDISICCIDNKEGVIEFAGAHNPLWLVRKNDGSEEFTERDVYDSSHHLIEFKADKQPIGMFEKRVPFKTKKVKYQNGDQIYLFSDGYADQFGGEKGKKFKYKNLKKFLLSLKDKSMNEQRDDLVEMFNKWRSDFEQVDDVVVVGVKL